MTEKQKEANALKNAKAAKKLKEMTNAFFGLGGGNGGAVMAPPPNPTVEIFKEVVNEIYSTNNIEVKTEVNDAQIMAFSQARAFDDYYNVPLLGSLVDYVSKYSISRGRKSRKEFEGVAKANLQMSGSEEREKRSMPARLFGG